MAEVLPTIIAAFVVGTCLGSISSARPEGDKPAWICGMERIFAVITGIAAITLVIAIVGISAQNGIEIACR